MAKYTLYDHQHKLSSFAHDRDYALWYAGVGIGKTGAALHYLMQFDGLRVVFCPKAGLHVFEQDWPDFGFDQSDTTLVTLDKGTAKDKQKVVDGLAASGANAIVVVNYATARVMKWEHLPITASVSDEVHKLAKHNGTTSINLARQTAHVPRKVGMTGTPYSDSPIALFGITRWFDPIIYPNPRKHPGSALFGHWDEFLRYECKTYIHNNTIIPAGVKDEERIASMIAPFTMFMKTEDYVDLPDVVNVVRTVKMTGKWRKTYDTLKEQAAVKVNDDLVFAPHILARIIKLQSLACSGILITENGSTHEFDIRERVGVLQQLLEEIGDQPVVIFTRFKRDVDVIKDIIDEDVCLLTGDVDTHQQWRQGRTNVLIANISAGGAAVRLERAKHMIFWSVGWSNSDYEQARGRIYRNGQQADRVFFHHIVTEDTVDEEIYAALAKKQTTRQNMDEVLS
jgi:hypothetical protein